MERGTAEDYRVSRDAEPPVWHVRSGNNLWTVYQLSRRGELPYEVPGDLSWRTFLLDVFEANPQLDQLDLIPTGTEITLPEY